MTTDSITDLTKQEEVSRSRSVRPVWSGGTPKSPRFSWHCADLLQTVIIALLAVMIGYYVMTVMDSEVCLQLYIDGKEAGYVSSPAVVQEAADRIVAKSVTDRLALGKLDTYYSFVFLDDKTELLDSDDCYALLSGYIEHTYTEAVMLRYDGKDTAILASRALAESVVNRLDQVLSEMLSTEENGQIVSVQTAYDIETVTCLKSEVRDSEEVYNLLYAKLESTFAIQEEQGNTDAPNVEENEMVDGRINAFLSDATFYYEAYHTVDVLRNPTVNTVISDELQTMLDGIIISYQTVSKQTANELIPFETVYVESDSYYVGYTEVTTQGQNGLKEITYEIVSLAGEEISRTIVSERVISKPVNAVTVVGTKPYPKPIPTGTYIWPLPKEAIITSHYGYRPDPFTGVPSYHNGLDIYMPKHTPIVAIDGGEVIYAGWNGSYGLMVRVDHGNGLTSLYAHMNEVMVKRGDLVYQGQQLGTVGDTGRATGYHLHLEIQINGSRRDPEDYLPER